MDYKNYEPASQCFLSDDDINENEHCKGIFFNLDDLEKKGTLNSTYDYLLKDWINDYVVLLPITTHTHTVCVPYYKAAPYNISHTKIFFHGEI